MRFLAFPVLVALLGGCTAAGPSDEEDVVVLPGDTAEDGKADGPPRVELKVVVRTDQITLANRRFSLYRTRAEVRQVWFYDTIPLSLYPSGAILRARKVIGGDDDSTVKLRPLEVANVDRAWLSTDGFKCEIDRVGQRAISSCSLTLDQPAGEIDEVGAGRRAIDKLFADDQERLLATHAGAPDWSALTALGPIDAWVWKVRPRGFPTGFSAERWELPDGKVLLEISTKVPASEADTVDAALRSYLRSRGLDPDGADETKTRVALDYFAGAAAP